MKTVDVKSNTYTNSSKDPNFKIGGIVRKSKYQKTFLQKAMFQLGLRKILRLKKLKILCCRNMLLVILMEKKLLERFMN